MLNFVYDSVRHRALHNMVFKAPARIEKAILQSFRYIRPILLQSVRRALRNRTPLRTGNMYELYVNNVKRKHIASRYGEVPAPLTRTLAKSVIGVNNSYSLSICETAPHARFLEGKHAALGGGVRYRPHLAALINPHNLQFRDMLLHKTDECIKKGV